MGYAVVGLYVILVLVFTILSWKKWHWTNSVFLILSAIAAVFTVANLSKVIELRTKAINDLDSSIVRLEQVENDRDFAIYGPTDQKSYGADSLRGLSARLELSHIRRGRVWSGANASQNAGAAPFTVTLSAAAEGEAQPAAAGAASTELKGVVLYAFLETTQNESTFPSTFLGMVRVTDQQANQLTVVPTFVVNPVIFEQGGEWSLFEQMPGDRYDTLSADEKSISEFRDQLIEMFPKESVIVDASNPDADRAYEAFIDQLNFNGFSITAIEDYVTNNQDSRISKRFQPRPEEVFVLYEFEGKSNEQYEVDGAGRLDVDGPYTALGEANDRTLHLGTKIQFNKGDQVLIDQVTSEGYQSATTQIRPFREREPNAIEKDRVYRRPLYDFPAMFVALREQAVDLTTRAAAEALLNQTRSALADNALAQQNERDGIILDLQADNQNLKNDVATISTALEARRQQLNELEARIAALEQKIDELRAIRSGAE
jgi:hypothetical protein